MNIAPLAYYFLPPRHEATEDIRKLNTIDGPLCSLAANANIV
jgi:hypothetical protein